MARTGRVSTTSSNYLNKEQVLNDLLAFKSSANPTLTNVSDSNLNQTLLEANPDRRGVILHNNSTEILYLKYGDTASSTSYTYKINPNAHWEMPFPIYTGRIDGIWASNGTGAARITELE